MITACLAAAPLAVVFSALVAAVDASPVTLTEDFEQGFDRWMPTAPENWKLTDDHGGKVLDLFDKTARTKPPHRSPFNFVLLKDTTFASGQIGFGSFDDTARFDDIVITGTKAPKK
ncbi:MAG: hypothetical protein ACKV19_19480 [Verrucomicrobiales bacterium]